MNNFELINIMKTRAIQKWNRGELTSYDLRDITGLLLSHCNAMPPFSPLSGLKVPPLESVVISPESGVK